MDNLLKHHRCPMQAFFWLAWDQITSVIPTEVEGPAISASSTLVSERSFPMSDGREERQQQDQRRQQEQQEERLKDRRKIIEDRLDRFPADPFHPERPDS